MKNILAKLIKELEWDIRYPAKPDLERRALLLKYGEHIVETYFPKEPKKYNITDEEADFFDAYWTWKHCNGKYYEELGYTEDDFILAEMEYEEYLESQNK